MFVKRQQCDSPTHEVVIYDPGRDLVGPFGRDFISPFRVCRKVSMEGQGVSTGIMILLHAGMDVDLRSLGPTKRHFERTRVAQTHGHPAF
jgi:hypothetical protein